MKTEILQDIFNRMYKIRLTEETIAERYSEQKSILDSRITTARASAKQAARLLSRGKNEKAKEEIIIY